jgi:hypothetical protein
LHYVSLYESLDAIPSQVYRLFCTESLSQELSSSQVELFDVVTDDFEELVIPSAEVCE